MRFVALIRGGYPKHKRGCSKRSWKCLCGNVALGDCMIAAVAIINEAKALSDDPHFDPIKEVKRTWI